MSNDEESSLIDELIAKGESQTVDFKKSDILSNPTKLAKLMTAFANSSGGRILIGVCDDGTLQGMKAKKEHEEHIMNIARDRCDSPLIPKFSLITKPEGDIYVIKVLRYQTYPHAVKTKTGRVYFIRVGTTVRQATPTELALLFESAKEEIIKKPKLELLLVDNEGNATKNINAQPIYTKIKRVRSKVPPPSPTISELFKVMPLGLFHEREPSQDLVPIGIKISNVGEAPAHNIKIFLEFPKECELINKHEAVGGLTIRPLNYKPRSGGLYVDRKNKFEARAWINMLGNDLVMEEFDKIYVKFPSEEKEHKIRANIIQHNFPPEEFEFTVTVKPGFKEKIEYVYEKQTKDESKEEYLRQL